MTRRSSIRSKSPVHGLLAMVNWRSGAEPASSGAGRDCAKTETVQVTTATATAGRSARFVMAVRLLASRRAGHPGDTGFEPEFAIWTHCRPVGSVHRPPV